MSDEQLELFSSLPPLLRPPRRLRRIGFELEQLRGYIAVLVDGRRELDQAEADLTAVVADARAVGHVPRDAYGAVVKIEELRELVDETLRDANALYRGLERHLNKRIDSHLKRASKQRF